MGLEIYGCAAIDSPDRVGEKISIENMDISSLRYLNDDHSADLFSMIGGITQAKKILKADDAKTPQEKKCWQVAKAPFLFVKGTLADQQGHPNAEAASALLKFCAQNPNLPLQVGFSIEGGIIERDPSDSKILSKTKAEGVSLTIKPCHPNAKVFLVNDLMKSEPLAAMPEKYTEALKKSGFTPSFKENTPMGVMHKIEQLKKSVKEFTDGITSLKCQKCGKLERFFKSSSDWPNNCTGCSSSFRMTDIYKALKGDKKHD